MCPPINLFLHLFLNHFRIRNCYFSVKDKNEPKILKLLSWTDIGPHAFMPNKALGKTQIQNVFFSGQTTKRDGGTTP